MWRTCAIRIDTTRDETNLSIPEEMKAAEQTGTNSHHIAYSIVACAARRRRAASVNEAKAACVVYRRGPTLPIIIKSQAPSEARGTGTWRRRRALSRRSRSVSNHGGAPREPAGPAAHVRWISLAPCAGGRRCCAAGRQASPVEVPRAGDRSRARPQTLQLA